MKKALITYLLEIASTAAAGTRFRAAYRCKLPIYALVAFGNATLDLSAAEHMHLRNALSVLGKLTGKTYLHLTSPRAISMQMLCDWDMLCDSTYTYRAASDMLRMA
ncbi:hypothetical protein [Lachnoclostridium edouardi]|uniref:hypothetical protein n=1 Tax=Lachnoclostridium edouardi TaxID=1926283 RepID=UPI000C7CE4E1|nr:hypothetical protein [Lachnoclostridium edouardi]